MLTNFRSIMNLVVCLMFSCLAANAAACGEDLNHAVTRDDVLVIANLNSQSSCEVAEYYADKRGIDPNNIASVYVSPQYFIDKVEIDLLRDQIIHKMQDLIRRQDPNFVPVVCSNGASMYYCQASIDQLLANTRIRYLVMSRGVPTRVRMLVQDASLSDEPTTVDSVLRRTLANFYDTDYFYLPSTPVPRKASFGNGSGQRIVDPKLDFEFVIGRLDGLTADKAKGLVDRAITAEENGVYGRLVTRIGDEPSIPLGNGSYNGGDDSFRYQLGIFDEKQPECTDYITPTSYLTKSQSIDSGQVPEGCKVGLFKSAATPTDTEMPPGHYKGRMRRVNDSLVYFGTLDGQPTGQISNARVPGYGAHDALLNWRKDSTCSATLCRNISDITARAECQASSTDAFKEINTDCVGVAEGFFGFNTQSWPVSYFQVMPTGWISSETGDARIKFGNVIDTDGVTDNHSILFSDADSVEAPTCYSAPGQIGLLPNAACVNGGAPVDIRQNIVFPQPKEIPVGQSSQELKLSFYVKHALPQAETLSVLLRVQQANGSYTYYYPLQMLASLPAGDHSGQWQYVEVPLHIDRAKHDSSWDGKYSALYLALYSSSFSQGSIKLDQVSLSFVDQPGTNLLVNGDFDLGHENVTAGDHAANFLSRLNGAGFWGSASHYQSSGYSFAQNWLEVLTYMWRGLPMGDAVWFNESKASGLLYGDPLYKPLAVRIKPVTTRYNTVSGSFTLFGSALNGTNQQYVATEYQVHHCPGNLDFYICDRDNLWQSTTVEGIGGFEDSVLGELDVSNWQLGDHLLRLSVTTSHSGNGKTQTFNDFQPVFVTTVNSDYDADGFPDQYEAALGSDPKVYNSWFDRSTLQAIPMSLNTNADNVVPSSSSQLASTVVSAMDITSSNYMNNSLAVNAAGDKVVSWIQQDVGTGIQLMYRVQRNGIWDTVQQLAAYPQAYQVETAPKSLIDENGNIFILWSDTTSIRGHYYDAGDHTWYPSQLPYRVDGHVGKLDTAGDYRMAFSVRGAAPTQQPLYAARYDAATHQWVTPTQLFDSGAGYQGASILGAALDQGGDFNLLTQSGQRLVRHRIQPSLSATATTLAQDLPVGMTRAAVDATGNILLAYARTTHIVGRFLASGSLAWTEEHTLEAAPGANVELSIDLVDGIGAVAWSTGTGWDEDSTNYSGYTLKVARFTRSGWTAAHIINPNTRSDERPSVLVVEDGVLLLWAGFNGTNPEADTLYFARYSAERWSDAATLQQGQRRVYFDVARDSNGDAFVATADYGQPISLLTVPGFFDYQVQLGDSWEVIAERLYGTPLLADELAAYYQDVSPASLPYLRKLPVNLFDRPIFLDFGAAGLQPKGKVNDTLLYSNALQENLVGPAADMVLANGRRAVAWKEGYSYGLQKILFKMTNTDGVWQSTQQLYSCATQYCSPPEMSADTSGNILVSWMDGVNGFQSSLLDATSAITSLEGVAGLFMFGKTSLLPNQDAWHIFVDSRFNNGVLESTLKSARRVANGWSTPQELLTFPGTSTASQVFRSAAGAPTLYAASSDSHRTLIQRLTLDEATQAWSAVVVGEFDHVIRDLKVDAVGNMILLLRQADAPNLFAAYLNASRMEWSTLVALGSQGVEASGYDLAVQGGVATVAWEVGDGWGGCSDCSSFSPYDVFARAFNVSLGWSGPKQLNSSPDHANSPRIAINPNSGITVAWRSQPIDWNNSQENLFVRLFSFDNEWSNVSNIGVVGSNLNYRLMYFSDGVVSLLNWGQATDLRLAGISSGFNYSVQATDSWEVVSNKLYGTEELADTLAALYPSPLSAGSLLQDVPYYWFNNR